MFSRHATKISNNFFESLLQISGNGNLLDGAKFAGLFVKQASYCSKEIVFVPGETIMRLKPKP